MVRFRPLVCSLLLLFPLMCLGQRDAWLPITEQEKSMQEVPGSPGADAIQLYYSQDIDDNSHNNNAEWDYRRIKILTEKGKDRADIQILVPTDFHVQELKARTIHPDGSIVDFTGKPFDKVIAKGNGFNYQAKSFTFPEVTVGSIIEYRYKLDYPADLIPYHVWEIQHDIYTLKQRFKLRAYTGLIQNVEGLSGVSASYNLPPGVKLQKKSDGWELEVANMPAFQREPFMPPSQPYLYRVSFSYGEQKDMAKAQKFWQAVGLKLYDATEAFIGNHKEVREAAEQAIAGETDPEKKLRKLYARVQQIRNLSYERPRTEAEQKKEDLKNNTTSLEVLQRGYGDSADIALLFVAMARATGFEASVMMSTNRSEEIFDPILLQVSQLHVPIARVKLNGSDLLLDPGTRFCPFGSLRWFHTATQGLVLTKQGGVMVNIPLASQAKALMERTADVTIDSDGTANGNLTVRYSGYEAMERRLEAVNTDEAGRKKKLEEEAEAWLPNGAVVNLKDAQPWDASEEPLEAHFTIRVPSYASAAGKRVITPNYLFRTVQRDAFAHQQRQYPVYFRYAFAEIDNVKIKIPSGLTMETLPQQQDASLPYARYQSLIKFDGQQIATRRALLLGQNFFPLEKYQELKDFFNKVEAGDEQQAVLHGGTQSAQK